MSQLMLRYREHQLFWITEHSMAIARQAGLQRRLLLALLDKPAGTVSDLARRLEVSRPTASRVVGTLLKRELIQRDGRRISITPAGEVAIDQERLSSAKRSASSSMPRGMAAALGMQAAGGARRYGGTLASMPEPFGGALRSFAAFDVVNSVLDTPALRVAEAAATLAAAPAVRIAEATRQAVETMASPATAGLRIGDLYPQLLGTTAFTGLAGSINRVAEPPLHFGRIADLAKGFDTAKFIGSGALGAALASAVRVHAVQLQTVSFGSHVGGWWTPGIAEMMPTTARMLSDLAAMQSVVEASNTAMQRLAAPLSLAAAEVVQASTRHFAAAIGNLPGLPPVRSARALDIVVVPASGSASFVHSARRALDADDDESGSEPGPTTGEIAALLRELEPQGVLAEALLGGWDRIATGGPDWARSAAHQGREVLNLTLERLSASAPPDPRIGKPTRRTRVRFVLGSKTLAAWAEAQADAVETTYALLSSEAHSRFERRLGRPGMAALLRSVEALLLVLLTVKVSEDGHDD